MQAAWLALIIATLYLSYFHNLGVIGLVGPDEPRYAWIAREMAESGDWITPRLYGKPWFEKPVLYYWEAAASFKLFGVSEASARLPSALSALLATLGMAWLAWRIYGGETARWLLLLLPTTAGMIGFSHAAATDMPFAGMLTLALVCASGVVGLLPDVKPSSLRSSPVLALFGFFLGLAVLAKGPAAIILSGGAVLAWATLTKRWRDAFRCLHPVAIASFCATALPWYVLCAQRNSDFFRVFILEHNFKRYLTPEFQHIQPFWFYVPVILVAVLPWAVILAWCAVLGAGRVMQNKRVGATTLFLLCWVAFCILFFTASKSKLPGYVLPAIPAIGLLFTRSILILPLVHAKSFRWVVTTYAAMSLAGGIALITIGKQISAAPWKGDALIVGGCVVLAFALSSVLLTLGRGHLPIAALCVLPMFLLLATFSRLAYPWFRQDPSGRTLAGALAANHVPASEVQVHAMKRGQLYSLNFYLHREIQPWNAAEAGSRYLLVSSRSCDEVTGPSFVCSTPQELRKSGWFLYRVESRRSVGGPDDLGGLGGRSDVGRDQSDRQPR